MSMGIHSTHQFNSSSSGGSHVKWLLLDQLANEHGSSEGWHARCCYPPTWKLFGPVRLPYVCGSIHTGHRDVCISWSDLQQGSQKAPAREEEKGKTHEAIPFGSIPRNVLLMLHALRFWQVYKWQILKNTPLWYRVIAKSCTNRLPGTIWSLWLSELFPWITSSKNANLSFSNCAHWTNLSKLKTKTKHKQQTKKPPNIETVFAEEDSLALQHFDYQWCKEYCLPMLEVYCSLTSKFPITRFLLGKAIQSQQQSACV